MGYWNYDLDSCLSITLISSYLSFLLLFIYSLSKAQSYGFNYFVILFYAIPLVQTYRHAGAGGALISFTSFLAFFYSFLQYHFEPLEFVTYLMLIQLSALYFGPLKRAGQIEYCSSYQNTVLVSLIFFLIIFSYEVELFFPVLDRFLLLSYAAFLIHNYMYRNGQPSLLQPLSPNGLVILFVLVFIGIHSVFELDLTVAALLTNAILISIAASFLVYAFRFQSKQAYFGGIVLLLVIVFLGILTILTTTLSLAYSLFYFIILYFNNYWEKKITVAQEKGPIHEANSLNHCALGLYPCCCSCARLYRLSLERSTLLKPNPWTLGIFFRGNYVALAYEFSSIDSKNYTSLLKDSGYNYGDYLFLYLKPVNKAP